MGWTLKPKVKKTAVTSFKVKFRLVGLLNWRKVQEICETETRWPSWASGP